MTNYAEIFFFFYMCTGFITEYKPAGLAPIRTIDKISTQFVLYDSFWWQILAVLPFQLLPFDERRVRLTWLLKSLRWNRGITFFNPSPFMSFIKSFFLERLKERVAKD